MSGREHYPEVSKEEDTSGKGETEEYFRNAERAFAIGHQGTRLL